MEILFLGWEFPPHSVGGLGTHSYNIIKALVKKGIKINVIIPFKDIADIRGVNFLSFTSKSSSIYNIKKTENVDEKESTLYNDVFNEVEEYKNMALKLSSNINFDVIHANDWVTGRAAIALKKKTGKKLIVTIHSIEYDRTAGNPWDSIAQEEKRLVEYADKVVTVSNRLKLEIMNLYHIDDKKISVIYNAVDSRSKDLIKKNTTGRKVVLFIGRLSVQKGIDNLIRAFKLVSEKDKTAVLYIVGEGPELRNLIKLSIELDLADKVIFLGRAPDNEVETLYSVAKVFVMPSVSEPFGIVALEAISAKVPTIISSQSGVSEVIRNALTVDFWDVQQLADLILGFLDYKGIGEEISNNAYSELKNITWDKSASEFIKLYNE
ncbi:MAG: Glycosyl transferase group 1 [Candidatus Parvarchaeum acidophilus ARMAN-5_'5-way FS']|jgi:glycosyltransferase involved in cell wall biosynthesis|uniref:Glycosyl transferase group 1 n=1 Tax=Candidatus Parvarchaeum acidophilus ARMAN-5_'5-way FS' TaxID=994838 RepID=F2UU34_PARA5|nr:MAG: Glycosyl transferase group 1 [Candidatus Parvarchaeum acidophilus ARMAN-5_'5-way FS']